MTVEKLHSLRTDFSGGACRHTPYEPNIHSTKYIDRDTMNTPAARIPTLITVRTILGGALHCAPALLHVGPRKANFGTRDWHARPGGLNKSLPISISNYRPATPMPAIWPTQAVGTGPPGFLVDVGQTFPLLASSILSEPNLRVPSNPVHTVSLRIWRNDAMKVCLVPFVLSRFGVRRDANHAACHVSTRTSLSGPICWWGNMGFGGRTFHLRSLFSKD